MHEPDEPEEVGPVADDQLRLIFTCCHPALGPHRPGGAHPAPDRRAADARDRPRLPRPRGDDGPAPRAGQEQDPGRQHPLPGAGGRRAARPAAPGARRHLPRVQRGLRRLRRATSWCAPSCAPRPSASPACSSSSCPTRPRPTGLLALMLLTESRRPARTDADGAARAARRPGPLALGPRRSIAEGQAIVRALPAPQPARAVPDAGGDRRRAQRRAGRRPTPTGARSSPSTTSCSRSRRRRSSR